MRSQKRLLLSSSFVLTFLAAGPALAQRAAPAAPSRSSAQFTLHRDEAGGAESNAARQKARAGDCAGALPQFDAAIRVTIEPTLRRDRGLCHEKLNDPYPAIDDYRAYLVARPDAPDADQIRERLIRLEESVGVGGRLTDQPRGDDSGDSGYSASVSAGSGGVKTSSSSKGRARTRGGPVTNKSYDAVAAQEKIEEAADESPLRFGEGFIIGPFLQMPRYMAGAGGASSAAAAQIAAQIAAAIPGATVSTSSSGGNQLLFGVGLTMRYAWSPEWTFVSEIGYTGPLERTVAAGTTSSSGGGGLMTFLGFEGRIALDTYSSNQLFLGIGPGYEYLSNPAFSTHALLARARFGYRHIFGSNIGLELGVDGGGGGLFGSGGGSAGVGLIASNIGFLIAF